jgi:hypothetical protein
MYNTPNTFIEDKFYDDLLNQELENQYGDHEGILAEEWDNAFNKAEDQLKQDNWNDPDWKPF